MNEQQASRVAKALAHPLRIAFMLALREQGKLSPSEYARAFGAKVVAVNYHVLVLAGVDAVESRETARRGGATEHFYAPKEPNAKLVLDLIDRLVEA
jgi:DNA-binding transcriptional ArsR family regulator